MHLPPPQWLTVQRHPCPGCLCCGSILDKRITLVLSTLRTGAMEDEIKLAQCPVQLARRQKVMLRDGRSQIGDKQADVG